MSSFNRGYFSYQPPETWEEGLLCGNGSLGAIVMGQPLSETIIFSHEKLFMPWDGRQPLIDMGSQLGQVRAMLRDGNFGDVPQYLIDLSRQAGYDRLHWPDPFFPAGDLKLQLPQAGEIRDYIQALDYSTGLATIEWQDDRGKMLRRFFVSRADGAAVLSLDASNKQSISCELEIDYHPPETMETYWNGEDRFQQGLAQPLVQVKSHTLCFYGRFRKRESGYLCLARVIADGGAIHEGSSCLRVENADNLLVLFKIFPLELGELPDFDGLTAELDSLPADFDTLFARHAEVHKNLFERTGLILGDPNDAQSPVDTLWDASRRGSISPAYFQRLFDAGRYEILSSSGEWPPHLQGLWSGIYGVYWASDYTQNGNVQTAIAGLLDGNLPECMDSYLKYVESLVEDMRQNARALYNCRGIMMPPRSSTHGLAIHFTIFHPMPLWTAGAGWAAHFFYDYWLHTCDDDFFIKRALPFMKEVALFYEDFLEEDEQGYWQFSPSYSPENSPGNTGSPATVNATMDIAIARELFNNLIEGCRTIGIDEDIAVWEEMLAKMPPYMINADGAVKEWCDPRLDDRYDHRHASHLYPLMYGVARELEENSELKSAFTKAYRLKLAKRDKEADIMAFGAIQMGQAAAHLGDAQTVWEILQDLASGYYYRNLATSHDKGPKIFNADLGGGMTALMISSIVQSQPFQDQSGCIQGYRIRLLPALPPTWKVGRLEGVLLRGGFVVDVTWDQSKLQTIEIGNPHANKCVISYDGKQVLLTDFSRKQLSKNDFD